MPKACAGMDDGSLDKSRVTTTVSKTRKDLWVGLLRAMLVLLLVGVTLLALLYAK